jgi:hypothetical protein
VQPFDDASLTWPWQHPDPQLDRLQSDIMRIVGLNIRRSRAVTFDAICDLVDAAAGDRRRPSSRPARDRATVPYLNEPWYC